ncbi:MAG: ABC transporter permease [Chloroflexi bacterium]|nr:ABC transporter permease [Chloroflexota bacterium]MCL5275830.1 ABC transporter permease [Chloroflexota bacterium]
MRLGYILRRFIFLVFVIWTAATVLFFIPRLSRVNPIRERFAALARSTGYMPADLDNIIKNFELKFGLDKPLPQQYVDYMGSVLRGDLGVSLMSYPKTVVQLIGEALPWTLGLLSVTTVLTFLLGTAVGALAGWPKSPNWVKSMVTPLIVLAAIPPQVLGLLLIYFIAFRMKLLPMAGAYSIGVEPGHLTVSLILDVLKHAILPAAALIIAYIGFWALGMRGMGVTVQGEDYVLFAEHKGLKQSRIFYWYYVRNAILPQVTSLALAFGGIIGAGILVEVTFGFPGIGSTLGSAIASNDYFVIYGIGFITIFAVGVSMLVVDLIYPLLDPRISYERK